MENRFIFRAKCQITRDWVYGSYLRDEGDHYIFTHKSVCVDEETGSFENQLTKVLVYEDTLGQSTGLKDSTGRLIFEGDVLFGQEEGDGETTAWTDVYLRVYWDSSLAGYYTCDKSTEEGSHWCDNLYDTLSYKIIGNIHENPELLEK